jgi:hypothetical protein
MTLDQKISIRGVLAERGVLAGWTIDADARRLCFFWHIACGRPINEFAQSRRPSRSRRKTSRQTSPRKTKDSLAYIPGIRLSFGAKP